jgi:hypothetical protein
MSMRTTLPPLVLAVAAAGLIFLLARLRGPESPATEPHPVSSGEEALTPPQREAMERLLSVGYLTGSEPAPSSSGVVAHRGQAVHPGLNLYTSGHGPEAVLMDMEGRVLHTWSFRFRDAFPDYDVPDKSSGMHYWRQVHLFDNGDLLAIYEGVGMIKLDRDSQLLWTLPRACHHDLHVTDDGLIHVLTRKPRIATEANRRRVILEDVITAVDSEGRVLGSISVLEAFRNSPYAELLAGMPWRGDLLHTNTIEVLDGSHTERAAWLREGNMLVSLLKVNVVGVVDPVRREAVWALTGPWAAQHTPRFTAGGNLLIFDNLGLGEWSRVMEIDPLTEEIVWIYAGNPENGFFTSDCGASQPLPNGNTLITESNAGRAFEVTREGEIVWEFYNPARAGDQGELIATLFEMQRLETDRAAWLETKRDR